MRYVVGQGPSPRRSTFITSSGKSGGQEVDAKLHWLKTTATSFIGGSMERSSELGSDDCGRFILLWLLCCVPWFAKTLTRDAALMEPGKKVLIWEQVSHRSVLFPPDIEISCSPHEILQ